MPYAAGPAGHTVRLHDDPAQRTGKDLIPRVGRGTKGITRLKLYMGRISNYGRFMEDTLGEDFNILLSLALTPCTSMTFGLPTIADLIK